MNAATFKIEGMRRLRPDHQDGGRTRARCDDTVFVVNFANNRIEKCAEVAKSVEPGGRQLLARPQVRAKAPWSR